MNQVHLQGIGSRPAKMARELHKGDTIVWNYGYKSVVLLVSRSASGKSITVSMESCDYGTIHTRRFNASTLVAVV